MPYGQLVFTDKTQQPDEALLHQVLGTREKLFRQVLSDNDISETTWKFYGAASGWTLQCKVKKKNLFYIQVLDKGFKVWFTLGKQGVALAMEQVQDTLLQQEIKSARSYAEGTSFPVPVNSGAGVKQVALLAAIKKAG